MTLSEEKSRIREYVRQLQSKKSAEEKQAESNSICSKLVDRFLKDCPQLVLAYRSTTFEPELSPLLSWLREKNIPTAFPRCSEGDIIFHYADALDANQFEAGSFQIFEPLCTLPRANIHQLPPGTVVLTPGVAFTLDGVRLGRGAGFYDRFFAKCPTHVRKVGLAFSWQIFNRLPCESWDQRMDEVIST